MIGKTHPLVLALLGLSAYSNISECSASLLRNRVQINIEQEGSCFNLSPNQGPNLNAAQKDAQLKALIDAGYLNEEGGIPEPTPVPQPAPGPIPSSNLTEEEKEYAVGYKEGWDDAKEGKPYEDARPEGEGEREGEEGGDEEGPSPTPTPTPEGEGDGEEAVPTPTPSPEEDKNQNGEGITQTYGRQSDNNSKFEVYGEGNQIITGIRLGNAGYEMFDYMYFYWKDGPEGEEQKSRKFGDQGTYEEYPFNVEGTDCINKVTSWTAENGDLVKMSLESREGKKSAEFFAQRGTPAVKHEDKFLNGNGCLTGFGGQYDTGYFKAVNYKYEAYDKLFGGDSAPNHDATPDFKNGYVEGYEDGKDGADPKYTK